jgi:hypothetical protein
LGAAAVCEAPVCMGAGASQLENVAGLRRCLDMQLRQPSLPLGRHVWWVAVKSMAQQSVSCAITLA